MARKRDNRKVAEPPSRFKRSLDGLVAAFALAIAAPLLVLVALAIWLCDGSPIFFRQRRLGLGGRPFTLIKFRTMVPGDCGRAGVTGGHNRKRITRLGMLLRRFHIDEIPQLLNVLTGTMSLVGPRPSVPGYTECDPCRLAFRPGITGLATVMYCKREQEVLLAATTDEEVELRYRRVCVPIKRRLDRFYGENWSFSLDFRILLWTLALVLHLPLRSFGLRRPFGVRAWLLPVRTTVRGKVGA